MRRTKKGVKTGLHQERPDEAQPPQSQRTNEMAYQQMSMDNNGVRSPDGQLRSEDVPGRAQPKGDMGYF